METSALVPTESNSWTANDATASSSYVRQQQQQHPPPNPARQVMYSIDYPSGCQPKQLSTVGPPPNSIGYPYVGPSPHPSIGTTQWLPLYQPSSDHMYSPNPLQPPFPSMNNYHHCITGTSSSSNSCSTFNTHLQRPPPLVLQRNQMQILPWGGTPTPMGVVVGYNPAFDPTVVPHVARPISSPPVSLPYCCPPTLQSLAFPRDPLNHQLSSVVQRQKCTAPQPDLNMERDDTIKGYYDTLGMSSPPAADGQIFDDLEPSPIRSHRKSQSNGLVDHLLDPPSVKNSEGVSVEPAITFQSDSVDDKAEANNKFCTFHGSEEIQGDESRIQSSNIHYSQDKMNQNLSSLYPPQPVVVSKKVVLALHWNDTNPN